MIGILGAVTYEGIVQSEHERTVVSTRFGDVPVLTGAIGNTPVAYIRRFGWENSLASDVVNHAAHALALRSLGVRRAITLNGFGGVNSDLEVGDLVIYHDFIKMCERKPTTVFFGETRWPRANMVNPFCTEIRETLVSSARANSARRVFDSGVNICVQGPHNETVAEIEAYRRWGADIVCTTVYPEVIYFRELEMCFAGLSWICDMAATIDEKDWVMIEAEELIPIMREAITAIPESPKCRCQNTWDENERVLPAWYREMR